MQIIYVAVIAVILIGGYWLFTNNNAEAPLDPTAQSEETSSATTFVDREDGNENEVNDTGEAELGLDGDAVLEGSLETEFGSTVVDVSGVNFAFDVKEIRVKEGDTVTINFESAEGFHDWVVDEFDAATDQVRPGTPTSVTFVADKAGTYEYYCSVGNHRAQGMVGTLIVE